MMSWLSKPSISYTVIQDYCNPESWNWFHSTKPTIATRALS